jgi:hypothetical protein
MHPIVKQAARVLRITNQLCGVDQHDTFSGCHSPDNLIDLAACPKLKAIVINGCLQPLRTSARGPPPPLPQQIGRYGRVRQSLKQLIVR